MPEGDTIHRAAHTLHLALSGRAVTRFETVLPALQRVHDDHPLVGRTVDAVRAVGKHLLMEFTGGLVLRTHMRMNGSWHIYRPGERWQRPLAAMRIVVGNQEYVAVAFDVPVAEFLSCARPGPPSGLEPPRAGPARRQRRSRGRPRPAEGAPDGGGRRCPAGPAHGGRGRQRLQVGGAVRLRDRSLPHGGIAVGRRGSPRDRGQPRTAPGQRDRQRAPSVPGMGRRPQDDAPDGPVRAVVGVRTKRKALQALRDADRRPQAGCRRAPDLLVPEVSGVAVPLVVLDQRPPSLRYSDPMLTSRATLMSMPVPMGMGMRVGGVCAIDG